MVRTGSRYIFKYVLHRQGDGATGPSPTCVRIITSRYLWLSHLFHPADSRRRHIHPGTAVAGDDLPFRAAGTRRPGLLPRPPGPPPPYYRRYPAKIRLSRPVDLVLVHLQGKGRHLLGLYGSWGNYWFRSVP